MAPIGTMETLRAASYRECAVGSDASPVTATMRMSYSPSALNTIDEGG